MSCSRTQRSDVGKAQTCDPRSRVKHSTTEPLGSLNSSFKITSVQSLEESLWPQEYRDHTFFMH